MFSLPYLCIPSMPIRQVLMLEVQIKQKLKDITLDIAFCSSHKRVVLFGPSGAGKSTILKMIAGFMSPKEGLIKLGNLLYLDSTKGINVEINRRKVGYLPQDYVLFPNMNIKKNLLYGRKFLDKREVDKNIAILLDKLEIRDLLENYPETLSGGQKQRVALARALFAKPSILLLDEPFSALHSSIRDDLRDLVINIIEEFNLRAILVTHDLDEAYVFGEDIVIIDNGKLVESGVKEEIFKKPKRIDTVKLLNIKNIWKIKEVKENTIITEAGLIFTVDQSKSGKYVAISPESVMIMREDKLVDKKYGDNIFSAIITNIKFYERYVKVECLEEGSSSFFNINLPIYVVEKLNLYKGKKLRVAIDKKDFILCN